MKKGGGGIGFRECESDCEGGRGQSVSVIWSIVLDMMRSRLVETVQRDERKDGLVGVDQMSHVPDEE